MNAGKRRHIDNHLPFCCSYASALINDYLRFHSVFEIACSHRAAPSRADGSGLQRIFADSPAAKQAAI